MNTVGYSLIMIEVFDLMILKEENALGKIKTRANFTYQGTEYVGMSVTDSRFYPVQDGTSYKRAVIVASIGIVPYNDKHYKFIAAIYT